MLCGAVAQIPNVLTSSLHAFEGKKGWRFMLMNAPVPLDAHDFGMLNSRLASVGQDPAVVRPIYTSLVSASSEVTETPQY